MRHLIAPLRPIAVALALTSGLTAAIPAPSIAQSAFEPVARVNSRVITRYELDQRAAFLFLLGLRENTRTESLQRLIEERLYMEAGAANGITVTDEQIAAGKEEFAGRANLDVVQFEQIINANGIDSETFTEFVRAGMLWRTVVQRRFGERVQIPQLAIERAIRKSTSEGSGTSYNLAEVVLPAGTAADRATSERRARDILEITSQEAFSRAALDFSRGDSREEGGALGWTDAASLPEDVRAALAGLSVGQVAGPFTISGATVLYQLRGTRSGASGAGGAPIDWAQLPIAGGESGARQLAAVTDTCDDLYAFARRTGVSVQRQTQSRSELGSLGATLDRMDPGEVALRGNQAIMLCGRGESAPSQVTQQSARLLLVNQRMGAQATLYLADLREDARIEILE